jgi:hypothetical protein
VAVFAEAEMQAAEGWGVGDGKRCQGDQGSSHRDG